MKKLFLYLSIYLSINSCSTKLVIRNSVEGFVFDKNTKQPIDSVLVGFFADTSDPKNIYLEKEFYTNSKGFFKIPSVIRNSYPEKTKILGGIYEKYLNLRSKDYTSYTIYIKDTIYRVNKATHTVYLDTIYLKQINK